MRQAYDYWQDQPGNYKSIPILLKLRTDKSPNNNNIDNTKLHESEPGIFTETDSANTEIMLEKRIQKANSATK